MYFLSVMHFLFLTDFGVLNLFLYVCAVLSRSWLYCDPMDCSPPGSSIHGILQARILEWVGMPSARGSFQPRDWNCISMSPALAGRFFTTTATWEAPPPCPPYPQQIWPCWISWNCSPASERLKFSLFLTASAEWSIKEMLLHGSVYGLTFIIATTPYTQTSFMNQQSNNSFHKYLPSTCSYQIWILEPGMWQLRGPLPQGTQKGNPHCQPIYSQVGKTGHQQRNKQINM